MTSSDKPREADCPCGRDRVPMTKGGNYRRHVPYLRRYNVCLGGKPVPAEMLAKADARDAERAERDRYDGLARDVRAAEWDYAHAVKAQTEAIAAVTRANTARDAAWQRLVDTRNAIAEEDARRAPRPTPEPNEASDDAA